MFPIRSRRTTYSKYNWWGGFYISSAPTNNQVENVDGRARAEDTTKEITAVNADNSRANNIVKSSAGGKRKYTITAYCHCSKCCGKSDGVTASGVKATEGVTVAMDKSIPFGTRIYIDGVGERIVQDRGGSIKSNRIDLYFDSHQEALNFGRQTKEVTILN